MALDGGTPIVGVTPATIDEMNAAHARELLDAVGLGDLARREGYVERQVKRWSTQWEQSKTRELAEIDEVARRLRDRLPTQQGVAIAHGDYRFGNCLTDVGAGRGNEDRAHAWTRTRLRMISASRAISASGCAALNVSRNRAVPSGTVGGRIATTRKPSEIGRAHV